MKISEISIKRPSIIIVIFLLLTLGGIGSYLNLGYELVPKFDVNVITVQTVYPGAAPSEVETSVSKVIEDAVSSLENVKKIETKSMESVSVVMITLNTGADVNFLLTDAQRKINAVINDLPEDAETPSLSKFSLDDVAIMNLSVTSSLSEKELYDLLDQKIQPVFARILGVAKVDLTGGEEREIQVSANPEKLEGYGLTISDVQKIIASSNLDFPTGSIKSRDNQTTIRLSGKFTSLDQMRNLPITTPSGVSIRLSDVADVQDGIKDIEKISRIDQKNTILMQVFKQSDANAVAVSKLVKKTIEVVEKDYKEQKIKIDVASDSTEYTINAASNVMHDLMIAVALVGFIMLFFLHSLRDAFIAVVAIPLSLIATFIGLYVMGYTLNLMSLLGLSLVVGILVDDAIVVIENIHRHMQMGKSKIRAAYDGAAEIGFTVTAITLVIVVVFLPIALSSGLVSDILRQFCVTVIFATLISLLVSFTVVPWLYSRFGKLSHISNATFFGRILEKFEAGLQKLTHWISGILEWALRNRWNKVITLVVTIVMFAASISLLVMGYIGTDFFPGNDKGEFYLQLELNKDASIEQTNFMTQKAESFLAAKPEIERVITTVGQASDGMMAGTSGTKYKSEMQIYLKDGQNKLVPTKVYAAKLKREMEEHLVGAKVKTVSIGIMGAEQAPLNLTVIASSQKDALEFADKAAALLRNISGATEVKLTSEDGNPEINVQLDRDKMNALGLNVASVGMTMQTAFSGNTDTKYRAGDTEYDINIRYDQSGRTSMDNVKNLKFINAKGESISLEQFADIEYGSGPTLLERRDKSPSVSVQAQVVGKPAGTIATEWETEFKKLELKPGVSFKWGGNMENQQEGFGTLGIALLASIILVYFVMVALYDSFATPFIVLFSIPLSFIGAFLLLALTNQTLNIFTILGIIMLIGLVAKNAIMLVDFANHKKDAGFTTYESLIAANHARLRPILMTTIAMVIGMVPIAMAQGDGADMNRGIAIVIIGGLLSSLFLTLIIVPVVYSLFDGIQRRLGNHEKVDYEAEMVADYVPSDDYVDEMSSKH
ncbi:MULTISPECIES: efflux RND transporter permease subunit [Sphingobacterium]|uniref:Efflux RND transporter permease subunit n=1 Tax=Sphingobacterium kitahiroshimense TaxID=470446 RepID=A0ABV0BSX2_9SPHI|nr:MULTISPECIES: efflux RND transporter permease subunit [unclassified Sphingobacterium]MBB2950021.1 hydrophobe/amphiphile efflux-1 (HAE1) family protein [Sphingobacterium sp. JUb56]MCS3554645.1 hydrophobe/amphiphile efflux-1 (HAE1) family protein [Sphingobacterium sp. JUb21]QQD14057.1 efflux RND transporter permease subunit [Sphingobacterium sp. UDSM-2020]TCR07635.1 CzcA family heavy metal efflux pump/hydrophobe/amphiphile efflux-1 (HAE1) family protein [Sphingobacterium sp. JUb20]